jgi:uncharacterized protein (TIGR03435 family)
LNNPRLISIEVTMRNALFIFATVEIVAVNALNVVPLRAQSSATDTKPPAFEAATIKRNESLGNSGGMRVEPGGRFQAVNAPVLWLVASAYSESKGALRPSQIIGAPGWLESEHYDIIAKAANPSDMSTFDRTRLLLRSLLEDRFQLRTHREQRQMAIYALVRARSDGVLGPRFRKSTVDCFTESPKCGFAGGPVGRVKADSITMDILTQLLGNATDRIVVDRTGLQGGFAIDLEWSPDQTASDQPSIFTAAQEQLGLKLESTRGPVDVLVIDHVEKPTPD